MLVGESGEADRIQLTRGDETNEVNPSVAELTHAFERILPTLTEKQMAMLRAHYHSGGRAVTMRELATASGYGDYKIANLQYGTLAKKLLDAMERDAPLYNGKSPIAILVLGEIVNRDDFGLEMHLVMHDRVALVLERIGVVESTGSLGTEKSDTTPSDAVSVMDQAAGPASSEAAGEEEWAGTMTLLDIGEVAAWLGPLENAVAQHRASGSDGGALDGLLQKLVQDLEDRDIFVDKDDINHWGTIAYVRASGREELLTSGFEELPADNVLALRRVLIVHKISSEGRGYGNFDLTAEEYWRELALKGELQKILQAFGTLYRNTAQKTLVSGWMG